MADITGNFPGSENHEKKKQKDYRKKYKDSEKKLRKEKKRRQKAENKCFRSDQKLKYGRKKQKDRDGRLRLEGKLEAYEQIFEKLLDSKEFHALPESVIEVEGEVLDV